MFKAYWEVQDRETMALNQGSWVTVQVPHLWSGSAHFSLLFQTHIWYISEAEHQLKRGGERDFPSVCPIYNLFTSSRVFAFSKLFGWGQTGQDSTEVSYPVNYPYRCPWCLLISHESKGGKLFVASHIYLLCAYRWVWSTWSLSSSTCVLPWTICIILAEVEWLIIFIQYLQVA